jgi:hypothetical protein
MRRLTELVRDAARHPVLLAPWLAAAVIVAGIGLIGQVVPPVGSVLSLLDGFLVPAFLAWWLGMAWEVAEGRRVLLRDAWSIVVRVAPITYLLLFLAAVAPTVLGGLLGGLGQAVVFAGLIAFNPYVDLMAAGGRRVDEAWQSMRDPRYWAAVGIGLMMGIVPVLLLGLAGSLSLGGLGALTDVVSAGVLPQFGILILVVVAVDSLLLVVREGLLQDARGRRWGGRRWPYLD